jgi:hypothetical protein
MKQIAIKTHTDLPKLETLEEVKKIERSEVYNSIYSIVKQIPRKNVEGDAMDAPSCAYELEQLFYEWASEQLLKDYTIKAIGNIITSLHKQQERMFTEEEVRNCFYDAKNGNFQDFGDWLENFKTSKIINKNKKQ